MRPAVSIVALTLALAACIGPPYPRGDIERLYPQPPRPELRSIDIDGRALRVAVMPGRADGTPLFFIHGSPGDWTAWARYLDSTALSGSGTRYAFDRPGFGGSMPGAVITDLQQQADHIAAAMRVLEPQRPAVLVGHSLGGPLVAWIALRHPEQVCGGVMVAGSLAPALEAPRWYNRLAASWLGRWLAPDEMQWSNDEMLPLQSELMRLDAAWPSLHRPLIAIQGERDELVDPRTADYVEQRAPAAWLRVERIADQGHFVLWQQPQRVTDAINALPCAAAPG